MTYNITTTSGSNTYTVTNGATNIETNLSLIGKGALNYGSALNTNFLRLLENFAFNTAPDRPITGQLWYDTTNGNPKLRVYDGANFVIISPNLNRITSSVIGNLTISANSIVGETTNANISISANGVGNVVVSRLAIANTTAGRVLFTAANGVVTTNALQYDPTSDTITASYVTASSGISGTLTTGAQGQITSLGTLTGLSVNGTANMNTIHGAMSGPFNGTVGATTANTGVFTMLTSSGGQLTGYHTGPIGANTANSGAFTTLTSSSQTDLANTSVTGLYTTNGVYYANGITIGTTFTPSINPPTSPKLGDQWYDTSSDILYTRVNDGFNPLWLDISTTPSSFDTLGVSGNATVGNLITTSGIYWSNGTAWSSGGSTYSNANVAAYLPTYTGNINAGNVKITSGILWSGNGNPWLSGITFTSSSTPPATSVLGDEWYDTSSDILYIRVNDGVNSLWLDISTSPNTFTTLGVSGNANVGNLITTSGIYWSNGTAWSSSGGGSTYSNANVAAYLPTYSGNITAGNINLTSNLSVNTVKVSSSILWANNSPFVPGLTFTSATTPPATSNLGDEWYDTSSDILYVRVNDGVNSLWLDVSTSPSSFQTLTSNGNVSIVTIAANGSTAGEIQSGRLMASYISSKSGYYDFNHDGVINSVDSLTSLRVETTLNPSYGAEYIQPAYGSSFGTKKVGIGFHSGTSNDINNIINSLSTNYTGNINAVVLGYMSNGPRISLMDYSLKDDQANVAAYTSTYHRFYGNVGIGVANAAYALDISGTVQATTGKFTDVTISNTTNLGSNANVTITGGSSGQFLQTNGSGVLSWATASSGVGSPGGTNTQLQYNSSGNFAGASGLITNGTNLTTVNGAQLIGYHTGPIGANVANTGAFTTISVNSSSTVITNAGTNGVGNIGASGAAFNTVFAKSTTAQYADLAEKYKSDINYEPGTVVVFGGDEEITITTTSHDTRIAGVISTNPAYLMNDNEQQGIWLPVALQGRVLCKVKGPVSKGDLVVSSDMPGIAERLDKKLYEPGAIIGKSLNTINTNEVNTIEVVVGRL